MKKYYSGHVFFLLLLQLMMASCVCPQENLQKEIAEEEKSLHLDSTPIPDKARAEKIISLYLQYANSYPDDTLSPSYLFKAAELNVGIGQFIPAMDLFNRVQRYPNYSKVATALFLQGFVAETHLQDTEKARGYYEKFIRLYPHHALAGDARLMLQQLSLSPEALIRMFEAQQGKTDSLTTPVP